MEEKTFEEEKVFERVLLFNPNGQDDLLHRRIILGNPTNVFNLNDVKYTWANSMYRTMMENFWIPEKVDLSQDRQTYKFLTHEERKAYDGILSFLVFLDSIQTNNLPNISSYITAPEVNLVLSIQTYQEAIHSQSYAYMIETIIPKERRNKIYEMWKTDTVLFRRNEYIAKIYQDFIDNKTIYNFIRVLIANYLLEGLYFYNGFSFFYVISGRNLMNGSANMIRYINRDEYTHCVLFSYIINTLREEYPNLVSDSLIIEMTSIAVEQEINWSNHIIGAGVLGINSSSIELYTKFLANERLKALGLMSNPFSEYNENPYGHLDKMADVSSNGDVKSNFFEATVTSYNQYSALRGWDDI